MASEPRKKPEWDDVFDFEVALKVVELISTGIYRSAAGILRELVSNAYDSNARNVWIETGFPEVKSIVVRDDGWGMTKDHIHNAFTNIGASQRALNPDLFAGSDRAPLGRFGIGFLSTAHISKHIRMMTNPRGENYALEVEFDLSPYFDHRTQVESFDKFTFGSVRYKEAPRDPRGGTVIELLDVDHQSPFYRALVEDGKSCVRWPLKHKVRTGESEANRLARLPVEAKLDTIDLMAGRERILWELGLICPVRYLKNGPVNPKGFDKAARRAIADIKRPLDSLGFRVYFDGIEAFKPILLPTPKPPAKVDASDPESGSDVRVYPLSVDVPSESGDPVKASGYVVFQPWKVVPQELRGMYVRVDNVGVGPYDPLVFRAIRGAKPIVRVQFSGELYVESGLNGALTIDRYGFDEQDPGYVALRKSIVQEVSESSGSILKRVEKVRGARKRRQRRIKEKLAAEKNERQVSELVGRTAADLSPQFIVAPPVLEASMEVDYDKVSAYPSRRDPRLIVDRRKKAVSVAGSFPNNPALVALVVAVDQMFQELPERVAWRKRFAKQVAEVLREYGVE